MDGEIDYSRYSLRNLREAESYISRDQYPKNYSNLKKEIQRRIEDQGGKYIAEAVRSEEHVWAIPPDSDSVPHIAPKKLAKYVLSFVMLATVLDIVTRSVLEANGY